MSPLNKETRSSRCKVEMSVMVYKERPVSVTGVRGFEDEKTQVDFRFDEIFQFR